jgi:hypothetical protein
MGMKLVVFGANEPAELSDRRHRQICGLQREPHACEIFSIPVEPMWLAAA